MHLLSLDADSQPSLTLFPEHEAPAYAVLSHTWAAPNHEVTFRDISENSARDKLGYQKIHFCGRQAHMDGLKYFWIDSCCIDKSSSAELSKAINSMFRWYRNARKCYVYLTDVSVTAGAELESWEPALRKSRWFTRGWTLQELLAPRAVDFFSREGQHLGNKDSLLRIIHEVTDVPPLALQGIPLCKYGVEEKFRWASKRQTTEVEDKAYSLLGIFEVFIAPMYGEGEKHALSRLRKAIEEDEASNSSRMPAPGTTNAVRMTIPHDPTADHILHMEMGGPDLDDIIYKMTGVQLRKVEGKWQAVFPNGSTLTPLPAVRINGMNGVEIENLFATENHDVVSGLKTSNLYRKEKAGEPLLRSCVSFIVPTDSESDVIMELTLGCDLGSKIALQLYADK
ncbi:hypothetical protein AYL99_03498 [Fonsecaea erecta]|uniref:Heterokaryon incompatibility domain-containing protein n=1 Tax=Fonsecaea erecta TaxID=1367422 RepID=A0A178ZND6_9EURO|nr:hypothetical protein AYL99_03498 [Fonsecaea erecta]OAP61297.1 hypothetical protein AYL99_03498 [Fonsecaea erecta]